uniref:Large ribosomal subunit protein bL28c n=1 Tax=Ceramothamnion japonicum TaxID=218448 RepID=A0A1C9CD97_CERJP|nr:ribosomal protein L28 [Ceramium japonicum]AOM66337.1 ribosomal protein L28 [Ceramium japonicum]
MSKICQISGKKANNGYSISHSHVRTKKRQNVNLQSKKIWSIEKNQWIRVKISTKALKTIYKS